MPCPLLDDRRVMSAQVLPGRAGEGEGKVPEDRAGTLSPQHVSNAYNSFSPNMFHFKTVQSL